MLKLCITFDYELFLGENYVSEKEVLFDPSQKLSDALTEEGVRATYYADVCSVFQYQKYGVSSYTEQFTDQICKLYQSGHDIQLHIHPNWLNSTYENGKWTISSKGYKLHDFDLNENGNGRHLLKQGKEYLENTLRSVNDNYRCIAYRAGGFCIQPETKLFEALLENGIIIDSSVAQKQVAVATVQDYNFKKIPNALNWWMTPIDGFSKAVLKQENALYEVCIGGVKNNPFKFLGIPKSCLRVRGRSGCGCGMKIEHIKASPFKRKIRNIKRHLWSYGVLSLDTRGYRVLLRDIDELYRRYRCDEKDQYVSLICHPKLASDEVIENMRRFVREVKKESGKYQFVTMSDIAKTLEV